MTGNMATTLESRKFSRSSHLRTPSPQTHVYEPVS